MTELYDSEDFQFAAEVIQHATALLGFDPSRSYCLHTGKAIGSFDSDIILDCIYQEDTFDKEILSDALFVRCIAAMRPSPALNKPDHNTILTLSDRRPADALSYLLNRLDGDGTLLTKRNSNGNAVDQLSRRILTHKSVSALLAGGFDPMPAIHWLLELDTKLNLHTLQSPKFSHCRVKNRWTATMQGQDLLSVLHNPDAFKAFESWVFAQLEKHNQLVIAAEKEQLWFKGNRLTEKAYKISRAERPEIANRKLQAIYDAKYKKPKAPTKPKSPAAAAKQEKFDLGLKFLDDLLGPGHADPVKPAPKIAKPSLANPTKGTAILTGGFKLKVKGA